MSQGKQGAMLLPGLTLVTCERALTQTTACTYGQINIQMLNRWTVTGCWSSAAEAQTENRDGSLPRETQRLYTTQSVRQSHTYFYIIR